jgi:3-oxoacyl-[acyl-carrier protein] reductase
MNIMKSVLITGASRGIGMATSELFLKKGYRVYACARNIEALKPLAYQYPETCIPIFLDFKDDKSIKLVKEKVANSGFGLDYIIHNAGHLVNKPFLEISSDELYASYSVNVFGPFLLTQHLFPLLNDSSHTVFISSMGGFQGSVKFPGLTAYSSSKAAEASLAECLQAEYSAYSHSFNSLCLGAVQTEMLKDAFPGYQAPLKSEEMATFIHQFTTVAHQFMKGKTIPVSLSTP